MKVATPKCGEKAAKINIMVEKFKEKALDADDGKFEILFQKLEEDLEALPCECAVSDKLAPIDLQKECVEYEFAMDKTEAVAPADSSTDSFYSAEINAKTPETPISPLLEEDTPYQDADYVPKIMKNAKNCRSVPQIGKADEQSDCIDKTKIMEEPTHSSTDPFYSVSNADNIRDKEKTSSLRKGNKPYQSDEDVAQLGKENKESEYISKTDLMKTRSDENPNAKNCKCAPQIGKEDKKSDGMGKTKIMEEPAHSSSDQFYSVSNADNVPDKEKTSSLRKRYKPYQGDKDVAQIGKENKKSDSMSRTKIMEVPAHSSTDPFYLVSNADNIPDKEKTSSLRKGNKPYQSDKDVAQLGKENKTSEYISKTELMKARSDENPNAKNCKCAPQIGKEDKKSDGMGKTKIMEEPAHSSTDPFYSVSNADNTADKEKTPSLRKGNKPYQSDKDVAQLGKENKESEYKVKTELIKARSDEISQMLLELHKQSPTAIRRPSHPSIDVLYNIYNSSRSVLDMREVPPSSGQQDELRKSDDNFLETKGEENTIPEKEKPIQDKNKPIKCKCPVEESFQTQENMQISYGVFCDGQVPKINIDNHNLAEVGIRSARSTTHVNIQRIKVRIKMKDIEQNPKKSLIPKRKQLNKQNAKKIDIEKNIEIKKGRSKSEVDYNVNYETTTEMMVEQPQVIRDGEKIRILIPLVFDKDMVD